MSSNENRFGLAPVGFGNHKLFVLSILYFALIPLMPIDPINVSKFQPSDLVASCLLIVFPFVLLSGGHQALPKAWRLYLGLVALFIVLATVSSVLSPFDLGLTSRYKYIFLGIPAWCVALLVFRFRRNSLIFCRTITSVFLLIIFFGFAGLLLSLVGINSPLTSSSSIIGHALPFIGDFYLPQRVISLLRPTSNVLALYLVLFYPFAHIVFSEGHFYFKGQKKEFMIFSLYCLTVLIGLFTYSRAIVPIILVPLFFQLDGRTVFAKSWNVMTRVSILLFATIFISLQVFTVFYPTDIKVSSGTVDTAKVESQKEIIVFDTDLHKPRKNTLYFSDDVYGPSRYFKLGGQLHLNHYAWLKIGALATKPLPIVPRMIGFGSDSFSKFLTSYSNLNKTLVDNLALYAGSQSQFFTSYVSFGILGTLALAGIVFGPSVSIISISHPTGVITVFRRYLLYLATAMLVCSLDMDFLSLRYIWSLLPSAAALMLLCADR